MGAEMCIRDSYRILKKDPGTHILPFWHAFFSLIALLTASLVDSEHDFSSVSVLFAFLSALMAIDMKLRLALSTVAFFLPLFLFFSITEGQGFAILYILTASALIEFFLIVEQLNPR